VDSQSRLKSLAREVEGGSSQRVVLVRPLAAAREGAATTDLTFPMRDDLRNPVISESFSILRSRLLGVRRKLGLRSVILTSAEVGDGKTLVATNLAISFGQLSITRVLFVDGDLRTGEATRILKVRHLPGLVDFLQQTKPFEAVVHPTEFASLSVVPTGLVPKTPLPSMLEGPRWSEFLGQARQNFDLIVVDSLPASAPVADLELLAEPCEAILIVVRIRHTHREALKRVAARLDQRKFLGVVINNSNEVYRYDYDYYGLRSHNTDNGLEGATVASS
jgi:capsular exopolysaccharide synthesis family protein